MTAIVNEFTKMRGLRLWPLLVAMVLVVFGGTALGLVSDPEFDPGAPGAWNHPLMGAAMALTMFSPLFVAVLASRLVDAEHLANGWLFSATTELPAGRLCRAKVMALGILVVTTTSTGYLAVPALGNLAGIEGPFPLGRWLGYGCCAMVIAVALLALHVLIAARFEDQLVGLGIGVLGLLIAAASQFFPTWAAHLLPWSYYALIIPAGYTAGTLAELPLSYPSIAALGCVVTALFLAATGRLDRKEL